MMFYKENNFKETPIGEIPKDWKVVKISSLFNMYKGTTPSTKVKEFWNGEIPFVTPTDITKVSNQNEIYLDITEKYITKEGLESKGLKLVPENSLLFTSRATIGYLAINKVRVAINQGVISLVPRSDTEVVFFYYLLRKMKNMFENLAGGSTYKEISMSTFGDVRIQLPSLQEQQKIAEVLSTLDKAIQKTNEIIAKTERLKRGLMQELLTKGIGHKEFKDTEIGRIPKDWEVVKLKDIVEKITNIMPKEKIKKIQRKEYVLYSIPAYHDRGKPELITAEKIGSAKFLVQAGDVLFAKINPKVPKIWLVEHDNALASTEFIVFRPNRDKTLSEFLYYLLQTNRILKLSIALAKGTVPSRLRTDIESFMRIWIPLPSLSEQQKIAEILSTIDKKLELERKEKAKLERIKQGLMDLLLTGKIRVKVS